MFLLYLAQGGRHYGRRTVSPYPRKAWAFQFIASGVASMLIRREDATKEERLTGPCVTVAGPGCVHGWGGRPDDECEVLVFQFDEVDYPLRSRVEHDGYLCLKISPAELRAAHRLHRRCAEARSGPDFLSPLLCQIAASELALLVLRQLPPAPLGSAPDTMARKVASALAWYEANLSNAPTIREVAEAVHLSPAHLRRLFHRVRRVSPQAEFTRVQFERAIGLMRDPAMTLEQIAADAGFGSGSAFSRAFKAEFGLPPKKHRAGMPGYAPQTAADPGNDGPGALPP